jgi:hypothetical protein
MSKSFTAHRLPAGEVVFGAGVAMRAAVPSIALAAASLIHSTLGCGGDNAVLNFPTDGGDGGEPAQVDAKSTDARSADSAMDRSAQSGDSAAEARSDSTSGNNIADTGVTNPPMEASPQDAGAAPPPVAGLRVANWSPDAPPVDFCMAPHGSGAYAGPVLAGAQQDAGGAGAVGLSFPQVSVYSLVQPGSYDVRVVVAGTSDCSIGALLVPDATMLGLSQGATMTVALIGEAQPAPGHPLMGLVPFADDFVAPPSATPPPPPADGAAPAPFVTDRLALRFIHAAPGFASVDLGIDEGTGPKWPFASVAFGHVNMTKGSGLVFDVNSYLVRQPLTSVSLHIRKSPTQDSGTPDLLSVSNFTAAGGSVITIAFVGTTVMGASPQLLECVDNSGMNIATPTPTSFAYSSCYFLSP